MNQYKKETSQIHAPADLILKTKQAVREEEKRIQQEKTLHTNKVQQTAESIAEDAGSHREDKTSVSARRAVVSSKSGYGKIYKWALPVAAASKEAKYKDRENSVNESAISEDVANDLFIEEVEEIPSFYDDQNTECITSHGLQFYVARQRGNGWKAYVSVDDTGYLITGSSEEISDQEPFVQMAYELLTETVEGIE